MMKTAILILLFLFVQADVNPNVHNFRLKNLQNMTVSHQEGNICISVLKK